MHGCMVWISNAKWSKRGFKAEAESLLVYSLLWACWCSLSCKIGSAAPEGCARIRSARKCVCLQLLLRWDWAFLYLWLVLPWVSSAPARQLQAGYLLAEKFQNFICSCQVKTERMINGDQIKGGKKLMKYCNSSWWHFKPLFFCWICRVSALLWAFSSVWTVFSKLWGFVCFPYWKLRTCQVLVKSSLFT